MTVSDVTQRYAPVPADQPADELEQALLARWRDEELFARTLAARAGARAVRVLRGPADGERQAGHPPRLRAHDQGSLLPPSRDEGLSRAAEGGLGHARPAGRDRGREAARHQRQAGHREARRRGVQPAVPRERVHVSRRLGEAQRADRLLARLRRSVRHVHARVRGERVVGARDALSEGAALSRPQDPAVLRAVRHGAVEPRGGAGLRGRGRSERVRRARSWRGGRRGGARTPTTCRGAPRGASSCGRRRRGRSCRTAALAVHPELDVRGAAEDRQRGHAHDHPGRGARARGARRRLHDALDAGAHARTARSSWARAIARPLDWRRVSRGHRSTRSSSARSS